MLFFGVTAAFAQQSTNSRIDRLRGGIIGMKFKWSGEAFSGLGSRADAMGGSISTLYPGPASISSNPSGLGFARGFSVTLDWSPPLTIDPGGILGVEGEINNTLMETAQNNSPGGVVRPGTVEDAVVNSELAMHGGLKGGAIMYGTRALTVAASFHQPFQLETQMNMSGIEFLATALDDQGKETNRIFGTVNGNLNVKLTVEASSLGVGTRVLPNLAVGMTYENFNGEMNFESTFLPEGIISSSGGDTRFFNDPARIQYDSLYAITRGDWEGNGARLRWGVGYHPNSKISLDAVVNLPFTIDLKGPFSMVYNKIRALNLGAGEDEEVFDVDILVEDNLTKTEKRTVKVPGMDIEVPGSFSVGFSAGWSNYVTSAVYTRYFDHLAYRLAYQQFDSLDIFIEGGDIHQGVDFKNAFRLGIGVEQLILGLGVVFGETFRVENKDLDPTPDIADRKTFFLPFFSLGGGVNLSPSLRLDYIFSPYNSSFIRFSTTYRM
ncbi:MAG: hypothetical protein D6743_18680 [Calditrichaeota bacterium]|nr:MAG: hypothetical protein D6743_18680 [Calditrichota bacterium]